MGEYALNERRSSSSYALAGDPEDGALFAVAPQCSHSWRALVAARSRSSSSASVINQEGRSAMARGGTFLPLLGALELGHEPVDGAPICVGLVEHFLSIFVLVPKLLWLDPNLWENKDRLQSLGATTCIAGIRFCFSISALLTCSIGGFYFSSERTQVFHRLEPWHRVLQC